MYWLKWHYHEHTAGALYTVTMAGTQYGWHISLTASYTVNPLLCYCSVFLTLWNSNNQKAIKSNKYHKTTTALLSIIVTGFMSVLVQYFTRWSRCYPDSSGYFFDWVREVVIIYPALNNIISLSIWSSSSTPAITSSPFFNPATSPCTIYVYWFWSASFQLQLSCKHGIPSLPPLKTVCPYTVSSGT